MSGTLNRYLYAPNLLTTYTQKDELVYIHKLRSLVGSNAVMVFKPQHAYQVRDCLKNQVTKGLGEKQANRHMSVLKHVFTKSIEWGVRNDHPMHNDNFKMFPE